MPACPAACWRGAWPPGWADWWRPSFSTPTPSIRRWSLAARRPAWRAGLGTAKLVTGDKGVPDFVGVLAGAATGFAGGVVLTRGPRLRAPDLLGGAVGGGYGLMVGSLLPTLAEDHFHEGRQTAGAGWLGLSLGTVGATLLGRETQASTGAVLVVSGAGALGVGMGAGFGWLWPTDTSRPPRIGVVAGSSAMLAAGMLAERQLHLSETMGPQALGLGLFGAGVGLAHGLLIGELVQPDDGAAHAGQQQGGAALLGASAGLAGGLLASRWLDPTVMDYVAAGGASVLGHSAGLGLALLVLDDDERPDRTEPALRLTGALLGLAGGAVAASRTELRTIDLIAGGVGTTYGAALGALAPNLHLESWRGDRRSVGGAHLGAAIGGVAATAAAHLTDASSRDVEIPAVATALGGLAGLGFGLMMPTDEHQPARIGAFSGALAVGAASIPLAGPLRLHEGFDVPGSAGSALVGGMLGTGQGLLLAGLFDASGTVESTPERQLAGGAVFGGAVGATTGFLLTRFWQPDATDAVVAVGGSALGGGLGFGLSLLLSDDVDGQPDADGPRGHAQTAATLGGSLLGLGAAAVTQHHARLQPTDALALPIGLAFGGLFGRVAPTLGDARWEEMDRQDTGALLTGVTAGGLSAVALRHLTGASAATVGYTALGGVHGTLTGLGVGLLIDDDGVSQAQRLGVTVGAAAGLGVGAGLWSRLEPEGTDAAMITTLSLLGAWNGAWATLLGHTEDESLDGREISGGLLTGAGAGSLLATALVPTLSLEPDLLIDAVAMNLLLTGAGAGAGALFSTRFDAPIWGLMGGGATGLLLGAGLHRSIDLGPEDRPLLVLSSIQGLWLGAWLPYALFDADEVSARQVIGGVAAGGLGGAALATLASPLLHPGSRTVAGMGVGSALGASMAGGAALIANDLHGRAGVGVVLGGTGAGLLVGGLVAPQLDLPVGVGYASAGAVLGASEALVFAWAGRADGQSDYVGAALVGAGLGASLGLAAATNPGWMEGRFLPAAGFAGWGAWMGSFAGALINRDPHEVTLGGLGGANVGFLAGWGLLTADVVEPRDIGWLSAFGAAGTVVGGGVGALFSKSDDPRPALAGLLIGPAVGLTAGAIVLPSLKNVLGGGSRGSAASAGPPVVRETTSRAQPRPESEAAVRDRARRRAAGTADLGRHLRGAAAPVTARARVRAQAAPGVPPHPGHARHRGVAQHPRRTARAPAIRIWPGRAVALTR